MKGTTIIELTDKSGNVERTIDHNYMTNAADKIFAQGGESNPTLFGSAAANARLDYLFGGLMCFDETIETQGVTDDPNIITPPLGVHMVANGVKGLTNTSDPTELGSYNDVESGWQADGTLRMVWDWTTSQGNGTIKCVSLASSFQANEGIGNQSQTSQSNGTSDDSYNYGVSQRSEQYAFYFGIYDDMTYYVGAPSNNYCDISNLTKLTLSRKSFAMSEVDYRASFSSPESYDAVEIALPEALQNITGYAIRPYQKGTKTYFLVVPSISTITASSTIYACELDLENETITATAITPSTYGATGSITVWNNWVINGHIGISDKYVLFDKVVIDYLSSTADDVDDMPDEDADNYDMITVMNDRFYVRRYISYSTKRVVAVIDPALAEYYPVNSRDCETSYSIGTPTDNPLLLHVNTNERILRNPRFLSTINNLSQPVTKTADKTMKVTYTLSFEEEQS